MTVPTANDERQQIRMKPEQKHADGVDHVREATVNALQRVLDPLLDLMFAAGITVHEFNQIVRDRAVRIATRRVVRETGRASKSRVAIATGLPRSEVARILTAKDAVEKAKPDQHPARRVLAAWHDDPRFLAPSGIPAELPIFGKRRSFEHLVQKHGSGLPVRAMLDELLQLNAVERLNDQRVRAVARVPVITGLSGRSIDAIGERARDLLETLTHNVRHGSQPFFESTAVMDDGNPEMATVVRREIAEQGANFINTASSLLNRPQLKRGTRPPKTSKHCRFGVTVYYFQEDLSAGPEAEQSKPGQRRKNLRRQ